MVVLHLSVIPENVVFAVRTALSIRVVQYALLIELLTFFVEQYKSDFFTINIIDLLVLHGTLLFPFHPIVSFHSFDSPLDEAVGENDRRQPVSQPKPLCPYLDLEIWVIIKV